VHDALPVVVFSHLRWDFVYQRPQHVLSRLAARRRVVVVEEPVVDTAAPRLELTDAAPNVTRCVPHARAAGFTDVHPSLVAQLRDLIAAEGVERHVAWLYTPMAVPLARMLAPVAVVYDCMDELSAFLDAPPEMLARESALLAWADVVFTGGPSLYRAKRDRHPNVHCFPSSVDVPHFRCGRDGADAADQAHLPRPRLGFYGVLDERLDRELIAAVADAHPEWQIVLVGPVVKIDPATLPRRPNVHYLGQRRYDALPSHLAGWDVCLLPFAENEATRFISPTKTLEYMAAERPIVSTPIRDVAEPYGDVVHLGRGADAFIAACERALASDDADRAARAARMRAVLEHTSWESTVRAMDARITEAVEARERADGARRAPAVAARVMSKGETSWTIARP
jgi:glycosyltransferase involved in cell wall biosynthesis